jgi:hypothetical protein
MNNLFIIGNGFDLAHGLKTNYRHFREFLIQMEKEECAEAGRVSISDDPNLLKDNNIKHCFESIVFPAMINTLSETVNTLQQKDCLIGNTPLAQLDEINRFFNDADKIVQWINHGSGQYYERENNESKTIKRFIALLEPKTGMISHKTKLNDDSAFWQTLKSEFGDNTVKLFQNGTGTDKTPFWLTLRLFIKMIDIVEGENWKDLEASIGTYNFEMIFDLFSKLEFNDDIYKACVETFFTDLYYGVNVLFNSWVLFTEMEFEQSAVKDDNISGLRPRIQKKNNYVELSIKIKNDYQKSKFGYLLFKTIFNRHPMAKKRMLKLLKNAKQNYFFTFNYTQTLERIYGIAENNICHIHGVAKGNIKYLTLDGFVFGHGRESFDTNVTDIVRTAYNITKKPVNKCIINNRLFFEKLDEVNNIYSYGFSFGDVDMPYLEKICQSIHDTTGVTWYFNDFRIEEFRMLYKEKIRQAGFNGKFDIFHID